MKLLICTQTMDRKDPALGFFVPWVAALSKHFEQVEVLCLNRGEYELPGNVRVRSLGKERGGVSRLRYALRFYRHLWALRGRYDAVFVHMNQEYILLGGLWWLLAAVPVYLWRNHYDGTWLTDVAAFFCRTVFCTSRFSYTAKYRKTVLMPVGVDVDSVRPEVPLERTPNSVLFLARLDPSKRPELLLEALAELKKQEVSYTASFVGGPTDPLSAYPDELKRLAERLGIAERVRFAGAVPNTETFREYRSHELFVNCSRSGMLDKTTYKAMASGCLIVSASRDLSELVEDRFIYRDGDAADLAKKIKALLSLPAEEKRAAAASLEQTVADNALPVLAEKLAAQMGA